MVGKRKIAKTTDLTNGRSSQVRAGAHQSKNVVNNHDLTPSAILIEELSSCKEPDEKTRPDFIMELLERLRYADDAALGTWLVSFAGPDRERRAALATAIGQAAHRLAPDGEPPAQGAAAVAWQSLLAAADHLYGSGAHALGRLPFLSEQLFTRLVDEGRQQMPEQSATDRRMIGSPGDVLANLAVSRQLREALSEALGCAVVPTYEALYEYDPPGSHVSTHIDRSGFEFTFHLILEHATSRGVVAESVLIAHRPGHRKPNRFRVRPGEAVVLRGRGTVHSWAPLGADERRTLTSIGFKRSAET